MSVLVKFDYSYKNRSSLLDSNMSCSNNASDSALLQGGLDSVGGTLAVFVTLFDQFVAPVAVIAGLIGNVIALFVLSERSVRKRSSDIYLVAINAVGVAFLACVMLSWINVYKFNGACQTLTYFTYVSSFLDVWYVVGFTVERYIAVHYPLRRTSLCTATKARRTVVLLAVIAGFAYNYVAWTSGVTEPWPGCGRICAPLHRYAAVLSFVHVVDTVMTLLLPFVIITFLNIRIAVAIFRQNRARQTITAGMPPPMPIRHLRLVANHDRHRFRLCRYIRNHVRNRRSPHDQLRVTKLLMTVSVAFLALNLPRHATRAYTLVVFAGDHYQPSLMFVACDKLFNVLYYAHFAINVVLYMTVGGTRFRSALRQRCCDLCGWVRATVLRRATSSAAE